MKFLGRKDDKNSQTASSKAGGKDAPNLFAICRRLQSRVNQLEALTGQLRRDINRIEKRQYRDTTTDLPPTKQVEEELQLPDPFEFLRFGGPNG